MESLPIINKTYEAYKAIVDINNHLEKRWRNVLGISLENSVLECLTQLIMAKNAPKTLKTSYLIRASATLEVTVLKLRLVLELNIANETKIFQTQGMLAEIGRMLGGWLKAAQSA